MDGAEVEMARWWGILGVVAILTNAVVRLTGPALIGLTSGLTLFQWLLTAGWCAFMLYAEAWKGFHKQFSPRVVQRAFTLPEQPVWVVLAAPLVCMGLFHATRKRLIVGWSLVTGIVLLVVVVRLLPQPWRGMVDAGVVLGLAGGTLSIAYHAFRAASGRLPGVPADWP
jgi:hypothetical protein